MDDVTITDNATASKVSSGKLDLMFLPDMMDDKDEDEDDDEELNTEQREKQSAKQDEEKRLELEKKKKLQKRLHSIPPGIDLFRYVMNHYYSSWHFTSKACKNCTSGRTVSRRMCSNTSALSLSIWRRTSTTADDQSYSGTDLPMRGLTKCSPTGSVS